MIRSYVVSIHGIPEDTEIKSLARNGSHELAIDLLVRKYRERILHHALYVLKDYQEAFDVCQEVFIKSLREPRLFDADFNTRAWLFRVTSNLCFNIVRDRRRRSTILETIPRIAGVGNDPFDLVFTDERQQRILAAMDQLTAQHRQILMLRHYSDLSYTEIAEVLGIKLGTVMSRLSRAKNSLTEALDAFAGFVDTRATARATPPKPPLGEEEPDGLRQNSGLARRLARQRSHQRTTCCG